VDEILALDEAVRRVEQEEPDLAGVVRLRFFAGLSVDETAAALGVSAQAGGAPHPSRAATPTGSPMNGPARTREHP